MNFPTPALILTPMRPTHLERELERLHPECWGWALACCERNRERAEDCLQSAYLRILAGRARFDGRSTFRTWVFGVIRLVAMEDGRRQRLDATRVAGDAYSVLAVDPAPTPDMLAEYSERSAALLAALATLSPRQREILHLVFYHDMSIEEAAQVMNVSLGSARTHYDRGKKALARELSREGGRTR